jgi:hypothetical protein
MAPPKDEVEVESISAYGLARSSVSGTPLSADDLRKIDGYFRASMYLCLGMLYLRENPLLKEPLTKDHLKARLLGHWGSDAGQAFTWMHFNRLIKKYELDAIFVSGPGHGAPAVLSQSYLEGVYSEVYPDKSENVEGMKRFFKQFSFPGGIGSHATPETPGSIHEGGELGYSISHAFGSVFDNPNLILSPPAGIARNFSIPLLMVRFFLYYISTDTKSTTPQFSHGLVTKNLRLSLLVTAGRHILLKGAICRACIRQWQQRSRSVSWKFAQFRRRLVSRNKLSDPAGQ